MIFCCQKVQTWNVSEASSLQVPRCEDHCGRCSRAARTAAQHTHTGRGLLRLQLPQVVLRTQRNRLHVRQGGTPAHYAPSGHISRMGFRVFLRICLARLFCLLVFPVEQTWCFGMHPFAFLSTYTQVFFCCCVSGLRDYSGFLALHAAIDFWTMPIVHDQCVRQRNNNLARDAGEKKLLVEKKWFESTSKAISVDIQWRVSADMLVERWNSFKMTPDELNGENVVILHQDRSQGPVWLSYLCSLWNSHMFQRIGLMCFDYKAVVNVSKESKKRILSTADNDGSFFRLYDLRSTSLRAVRTSAYRGIRTRRSHPERSSWEVRHRGDKSLQQLWKFSFLILRRKPMPSCSRLFRICSHGVTGAVLMKKDEQS